MSKRPAKRKASTKASANLVQEDDILNSLDISKTTPKQIASSLLSLLPSGATKQNPASKKLLKVCVSI